MSSQGITSNQISSTLRCNRQAARQLPGADETFTLSEFDSEDPLRAVFDRFVATGIIQAVSADPTDRRWRTNPSVEQWVETYGDSHSTAECGHSGIHNICGGAGYTCCNPKCGFRFGRDEAQRIMERWP